MVPMQPRQTRNATSDGHPIVNRMKRALLVICGGSARKKEIGGGERHEGPFERKTMEESTLVGRGWLLRSGSASAEICPKRPENRAFPVIQDD